MSLINMQDAYLSFSNLEILKNSTFYINENERVCLIGKNGAGKSTLLKIINRKQDLDQGSIVYKKNIKIAYLKQENPQYLNISIYDFISSGLNQYKINQKKNIQDIIQVEKIITSIELNKNNLLSSLSGGLLRKAALGRVLIGEPDILLLDEPTNHLDINTVQWLETFLKKFHGSILFVSHDRNFIQNICTRIIDLDRGKLISWPGDYKNFIKLKNENNRVENIQKKLFDKKLDKEEQWIKKGIKARATRNEGRVKNLKKLRKEQENYKKIEKINNIEINQSKKYLGKIIFKLEKINFIINNQTIIKDFSSIIQNGDKLAIIGKNGCGKSSLIKIILGEKKPQTGKIYESSGLKISYFDQNRSLLDPNKSIIENIAYGTEKIILNGREQHVIGYLKKFLFKTNKLQSLVKTLSGGECNRLLLARVFLQESNVLILDEPTNDLDLDTLQLLEKIIINYAGTVIIVSHDKEFIKNTVKKYWIFEENGYIKNYYENYQFLKKENLTREKKTIKKNTFKIDQKIIKKNNFKKELNLILLTIQKIELDIKTLQKKINQTDFFQNKLEKRLLILNNLSEKEKILEKKITSWENLEKIISK